MLHTTPLIRFRTTAGISLVIGMALLAGCAQQQPPGYYATPHDSTLADAQQQAQGHRGTRAPSQLQFGFGDTPETRAEQHTGTTADGDTSGTVATPAQARPLLEAKTFLGTVPCLTQDADCPASRITLTLAPGGEWRSRTVLLDTLSAERPLFQQGCWNITGTDPLRILLRNQNQEGTASFTFVNDNVLRVNMYNDTRPVLDYHLTRQADIDPIDELADQPALSCD